MTAFACLFHMKSRECKSCFIVIKLADVFPLYCVMTVGTGFTCKLISVYGLFQMATLACRLQSQERGMGSYQPELFLIIQHGLIADPIAVSMAILTFRRCMSTNQFKSSDRVIKSR